MEYFEYTTKENDTFDIIALDFYADESQSQLIIKNNPQFSNIIFLKYGTKLKIPIIIEPKKNIIPP